MWDKLCLHFHLETRKLLCLIARIIISNKLKDRLFGININHVIQKGENNTIDLFYFIYNQVFFAYFSITFSC